MVTDDKDVVLYWPRGLRFWERRVIYGKGALSQGQRHGMWCFWYKNGQKQLRGEYIKGKKTGLWMKWTPQGNKLSEGEFLYGKMHGTWKDWHQNGSIAQKSYWVMGKRDGTWTIWDLDGTIQKKETYDHQQEKDLGYSIHTDLETKELVRSIQRENLSRTWKGLVGPTIAKFVKPWHIACWVFLFIPFFSFIPAKTQWRGAAVAALLAFVFTSIVVWIFKQTDTR